MGPTARPVRLTVMYSLTRTETNSLVRLSTRVVVVSMKTRFFLVLPTVAKSLLAVVNLNLMVPTTKALLRDNNPTANLVMANPLSLMVNLATVNLNPTALPVLLMVLLVLLMVDLLLLRAMALLAMVLLLPKVATVPPAAMVPLPPIWAVILPWADLATTLTPMVDIKPASFLSVIPSF